jgi:hypothetical protein
MKPLSRCRTSLLSQSMSRLEIVYGDKLLFDANVSELKFGQDADSVELRASFTESERTGIEGNSGDLVDEQTALLGAMPGWDGEDART